jgi:hypothetical protein
MRYISATCQANWARKPKDLVGGDARNLTDALAAAPPGRLVMLGEPGARKTIPMVGLVLAPLHADRRSSRGPVSVLASQATLSDIAGIAGKGIIGTCRGRWEGCRR